MNAVGLLLRLELALIRRNRTVLTLFVFFPLLGMVLPSATVLLASKMVVVAASGDDPLLSPLYQMAQSVAAMSGLDLTAAARWLLLRLTANYYLMMPALMVPITASFAVAGERQQRTLEPLLATPLSDRAFCLGKLLSSVLPAVSMSWLAAMVGALLAAVLVYADHGLWLWPDGPWWLALGVLTPLLGLLVAQACLWVSVRARDTQAASQISVLVVTPILVLVMSVLGPRLVLDSGAIGWGALALVAVNALLWPLLRRQFQRTGALGRD